MTARSVVIYRPGPLWRPGEPLQAQDHVFGHIRFIRRMLGEQAASLAGPFARLDECVDGDAVGMVVFDLPVDAALAQVAGDPAVEHGLLLATAYPFHPAA